MEIDPLCVICGDLLSTGKSVTVTRGLQSLLKASAIREDGLHEHFSEVNSVTVHSDCRRHYTRPSSMKAVSQDDATVISRTSRASEDSSFNFKTHCLFCEEEASMRIETKEERRRKQRSTGK